MRHFFLLALGLFLSFLLIIYVYEHHYYDPLDNINTKYLFNIDSNLREIDGESLIGFSFKGEFIDIYKYDVENLSKIESIVANKEYLEDFLGVRNISKFYNWTPCSVDTNFICTICSPILGTAPNSQLLKEFVEITRDSAFCCLYESDCRYYLFVIDVKKNVMYFLQCKV